MPFIDLHNQLDMNALKAIYITPIMSDDSRW